jgi:hypothetical protein
MYHFIVGPGIFSHHGQFGRSTMIKCRRRTAATPVGYSLVGVLLLVCSTINYPCRACIWSCLNGRAVDIYGVIMNIVNSSGVVYIGNIVNFDILVGCLPDLLRARPGNIGLIIINIGIINYSGVMDNAHRI